jgi:sigma-B regulation protein RsbU (phosphoserine phosphatase)
MPGTRIRWSSDAMALGFFSDAPFSERSVNLAPGDALVLFSDGVTEAVNVSEEFFGDDRLRSLLLALSGMDASGIGTAVVADVDEFVGDTRPHDDLSLVVLRRVSERRSTESYATFQVSV